MKDELQAVHNNNTWELLPQPSKINVVSSKWVYHIKYKEDCSINRFKAHLVAKDFTQVSRVDYDETSSLMVKPTIIHLVIALSLLFSWSMCQYDVKNEFLHGHVTEMVYMEQPSGFIDFFSWVCVFIKDIIIWFETSTSCLVQSSFTIFASTWFLLQQSRHIFVYFSYS